MAKQQKTPRLRIDALLVEQGLAEHLKEAQALILSGVVYHETLRIDKPGVQVAADAVISVKNRKGHGWVSRGGVKLAHGLSHFHIPVEGLVAIDVGCSTGGFTDVLLSQGARKIYAVDVGYGELAWRLRNHPSVVVLERTNARYLTEKEIPEAVDIVVCDASFISLKTVLPAALKRLKTKGMLVALIKPQFEVAAAEVGEKGVVTDPALHQRVCDDIAMWLGGQPGWQVEGITKSPIKGPEGNTEFLIYAQYQESEQ